MQLTRIAAVVAGDTSATFVTTGLTNLIVSRTRDRGDTLRRAQSLCLAKLDFWCPYRASNMDPVVVCCPLEGFSRIDWAIRLFLPLPVEVCGLLGLFTLESFTLLLLL